MRGQRHNENSSANTAAEINQPFVLTVSSQYTKDEWVLDSGCTFHITPNKELMFDLKEFEGGKVHMANSTYSEVKGIGKIRITNPDGTVVILTDVRYMPDMSRNLISYGMLEKSGCTSNGDWRTRLL
uniref:Retrovirus-related Pol polyprotein from transposon TNT 1-94 n=1 Tax=Noccaea caerulescens TaxID=107243 RepID=A0A1J3EV45_NOCCA